jgi:hypothetical protein
MVLSLTKQPLNIGSKLDSNAEAAPLLAQYIGETDREVFAVAAATRRSRELAK